ncbi:4942_t:CDS:2 [Paraglomus occultum]|uniref:4942_t:CDS:1 n=1 Tax=Paraglomus occultum TaxID=144539 RepID=A0A9N8VNF0_9GLOM|nr:4942_t:CDS:2 [Paraglomus occultum]
MSLTGRKPTITLPWIYEDAHPPVPLTRKLTQSLFFAVLFVVLATSVFVNVSYFSSCNADKSDASIIETSLADDLLPPPPHPELKDLILVAGHAIYIGDNFEDIEDDENWVLEKFQRDGQVKTFLKHIQRGVELAQQNEESLLIFSGGQTRPAAGARSEAQSYWVMSNKFNHDHFLPFQCVVSFDSLLTGRAFVHSKQLLAQTLSFFSNLGISPLDNFPRATTEEYARDSYENLLFSLCRFYEFTGHYPRNVTVVGFEFKKKRFIELHRAAVKFPEERFSYVGIDPDRIIQGKQPKKIDVFESFKNDLYGCSGKLREKKLARNPFRRSHPYRQSCPSIAALFNYCPKKKASVYPDNVPWE